MVSDLEEMENDSQIETRIEWDAVRTGLDDLLLMHRAVNRLHTSQGEFSISFDDLWREAIDIMENTTEEMRSDARSNGLDTDGSRVELIIRIVEFSFEL
mmetsp:Transcript_17078/g.34006  ORF Transcript_17078/g.34006 Transcript_17078/m.34006 type:complete len:99 (+) Transcript_17078:159-455(+)